MNTVNKEYNQTCSGDNDWFVFILILYRLTRISIWNIVNQQRGSSLWWLLYPYDDTMLICCKLQLFLGPFFDFWLFVYTQSQHLIKLLLFGREVSVALCSLGQLIVSQWLLTPTPHSDSRLVVRLIYVFAFLSSTLCCAPLIIERISYRAYIQYTDRLMCRPTNDRGPSNIDITDGLQLQLV